MKTRNKLEATQSVAGLIAIAIIAIGIIACNNDNGKETTHTHEWEWVVTDPATPDADGVETETCKTCGQTNGTRPIAKITCKCPEGTTHEPDEKCCEGKDCICPIAEPPVKEFLDKVMFKETGYNDFLADIVDARTKAGSKTLDQIFDANNKNILERIQSAVAAAYGAGNGIAKSRYRTIFGNTHPDGSVDRVVITIENNTTYGTDGKGAYEVGKTFTDLRISFEYLTDSSHSAADLQAAINSAVMEMKAVYDSTAMSNDKESIFLADAVQSVYDKVLLVRDGNAESA
jgi:hypothetical protein